ncbi:hypothetical protein BBK36DRAFT_1172031 [Trichoderma citrinoviride]|uniref:Uncharacterized protein n=1 Tax=Trichoderma citrinoviride TaxID=58853 RepID=A0A2T4B1M9_9HYPO|nr:hypothetical protein BBK36DRAFT_1172031 [Trichoderma citrinoviride]PTB63233.1 hypothetical protein BBK36DRAFT_1172031 [Trichoderma citrinoviride]
MTNSGSHLPLSGLLSHAQTFGDEAQGILNTDWVLEMRRANATAAASIPGYNVAVKYPGERSGNWTVSISVSSDILGKDNASGCFVTGTQIDLTATQGLSGSADPSWFICRSVYSSSRLKSSDPASGQGNCSGLLSDDCWSVLQESLQAGTQCQNNTLPPVCVDELGLSDGEAFGLTSANSSTSLQMRLGNESHQRGNFTAYDKAIRQIWVVITGFAETGRVDGHPRGAVGQPGNVACIQVNEIQQGSRTFENTADTALLSRMIIWVSSMVATTLVY